MTWHVDMTMAGTLTDEQAEAIGDEDAVHIVHFNNNDTRTVRVIAATDADGYAQAVDRIRRLPSVDAFIVAGVLTEPISVRVDDADAHGGRLDAIGTAEIAQRLDVSPARIRELRKHPDWPKPLLTLPNGEEIHDPARIDKFKAGRNRSAGRPRKAG